MIGSFITRCLVMVLGYAYPAYECFKTVEKNKPDIEQLLFWCQYWILVAVLTVCERVGDAFISWIPMYSEAKLAFFVYLWYPRTKGTTYVYDSFFRPYIAKHETEIDRNIVELRTRAGDMAFAYFHRAANYGQTRVFDILQYIAAQSSHPPPHRKSGGVRIADASSSQKNNNSNEPKTEAAHSESRKEPTTSEAAHVSSSSSSSSSSSPPSSEKNEAASTPSLSAAASISESASSSGMPSNEMVEKEEEDPPPPPVPSNAKTTLHELIVKKSTVASRIGLRKTRSSTDQS